MFKKHFLFFMLFLVLLSVSGCSLMEKNKENPIDETEAKIKEQISQMTLEEKIGQMLITGIDGLEFNTDTQKLIEEHKIGGIIILGGNVQNTEQLLRLINSIKKENQKNNIPLFMSLDEEGGRVTRMPKEFKKFPTNKWIGEINNPTFSYEIGRTIAGQIKAFGFNMNYAPVLDVNSNPNNPVIGDRSFSSDPNIVKDLGIQTMKGIQSQNVISVVKHFPGHGDTSVDSHKGLPTVNHDLESLENLELVPFLDAIKNEADAVMIAHILLSKIDKDYPSSMSKAIITDVLRSKLKFDGVVITDDMTMGAIIQNYDIGKAAVKSVNAGVDVVMVCHGYHNIEEVINTLTDAAVKGEISEERIDESVFRILKLKEKYELNDEEIIGVDVEKINGQIRTLLESYESPRLSS